MSSNDVYSAAIGILNCREDQLMHESRGPMKSSYADPNYDYQKRHEYYEAHKELKGRPSSTASDTVTNDKTTSNWVANASMIEKKKRLEQMKDELLKRSRSAGEEGKAERHPNTTNNTSNDMSGYKQALHEGKTVYDGKGADGNDRYEYLNSNSNTAHYGEKISTSSNKDEKQRQEMQERWEKNKDFRKQKENATYYMNDGEYYKSIANAPNGYGLKANKVRIHNGDGTVNDTYEAIKESNKPVRIEGNTGHKDFYTSAKDLDNKIKTNLSSVEQKQKQQEAIAKYSNQGSEKSDEQKIAEKSRGQYIRAEQKEARKEELEQKKQELLDKANNERNARETDLNAKKQELLNKSQAERDARTKGTKGFGDATEKAFKGQLDANDVNRMVKTGPEYEEASKAIREGKTNSVNLAKVDVGDGKEHIGRITGKELKDYAQDDDNRKAADLESRKQAMLAKANKEKALRGVRK